MKAPIVVNLRTSDYDIYIGRGSPFGNPFKIGVDGDRDHVIFLYREYILQRPELLKRLPELAGKKIACYCKPKACHGDVLVELVKEIA